MTLLKSYGPRRISEGSQAVSEARLRSRTDEGLISAAEAGEIARISTWAIRRAVKSATLRNYASQESEHPLLDPADVRQWARERRYIHQ